MIINGLYLKKIYKVNKINQYLRYLLMRAIENKMVLSAYLK